MNFKSVINQEGIKTVLRQYVQSGRIPQALLLLGPEGAGKLALALAFAQYIQCENPGTEEVCGECNSCKRNNQFAHPDLHFSFPTVKLKDLKEPPVSNDFLKQWREMLQQNYYFTVQDWLDFIGAEGKQANITRKECLQIGSKLSLKSYTGRYKILIMWMPEYLGNEGNRLLKLIEEPPEQTLFILVGERPERILPTILSRCQIQYVPALSDVDVAQGLIKLKGMPEEEALRVAALAEGNLSEAIKMAEDSDHAMAEIFRNWLRVCFRPSNEGLINWVTAFCKNGREEQKSLLRYGIHFCREIIAYAAGNAEMRLTEAETKTAMGLTTVLDPLAIGRMSEMFTENIYFVERNANADLLFLKLSLDLVSLMRDSRQKASV